MELDPLRGFVRRLRAGSGDFSRHRDQYQPGNKLTLLHRGGHVFDSMLSAIDEARESVHLETYILRGDRTGRRFAERLREKAKAGVRVRVIFDSIGSLDIDPVFLNRMRNAGVQFLEYHPVAPWRPRWTWLRRDHRKILIVDAKVAFTGGVNICDDHAPAEEGGADWRDVHVRVEGPAAYELDRLFRAVWFKETGRWFAIEPPRRRPTGPALVWAAANQEFIYRYRIRSAYLSALRAAKYQVIVANAYFVPDTRFRRALAAAARRGVSVKVLVPGQSDIRPVMYAGRALYDYLLSRGVRLFEWAGPVLHAKAAAVDGTWSTVGSYNMVRRSLLSNLEVTLNILDRDFGATLTRQLEADIAQSRELDLAAWRRRPTADKALEQFFFSLRHFF